MKHLKLATRFASIALSTVCSIGSSLASPTDVVVYNDVSNRTIGIAIRGENVVVAMCPPGKFIERFDLCTNEKVAFKTSQLPALVMQTIRDSVRDTKVFDQLAPLSTAEVEALVNLPTDASTVVSSLPQLEEEATNFRKLLQIMPGATGYQDQLKSKEAEIARAKSLASALHSLDRIVASVIEMITKPELTPFVARMNENKLIAPLFTRIVAGSVVRVTSVRYGGRQSSPLWDISDWNKCIGKTTCEVSSMIMSIFGEPRVSKGFTLTVSFECLFSKTAQTVTFQPGAPTYSLSCE